MGHLRSRVQYSAGGSRCQGRTHPERRRAGITASTSPAWRTNTSYCGTRWPQRSQWAAPRWARPRPATATCASSSAWATTRAAMFEWAAVGFIYAIGVLSVGPHQRAYHGRHLREVDSPGGAGRGQHPGDQFRSV